MNTLSITRDGREIAVLGAIGDIARIWIGGIDAGAAVDLDIDDVAKVINWLDMWMFGQGQTAMFLCNQHHSHRSPYEVDLCNRAYQHVEALQAYAAASGRDERALRKELSELQGHIRAIMQAVQEMQP